MDTSFLAPGPITWPMLITCLGVLYGTIRAAEWALGKVSKGTKDAVSAAASPLTIDMAAAKIEIRSLDEKLNAFKIEVARTYVTGDVITRLERRIDDMVTSVRDEVRETKDTMLRAFMERPPPR